MHQFNFLNKLLGAEPSGFPLISIFLNTEPNETGKREFEVFLKKQLSDHAAVLEAGSSEQESFEKDTQKINDFIEGLDASVRGVAIFACAGQDDFFQTFEFEVAFDENKFYLFDRPYLYPLVRLMDQNPTFAIVSADTNSANIYVVRRAETVRHEEIQNTKTNRSEVGGWSQMRYQRHIDNFHQQHAKEVIEELDKIVRGGGIEHVVLAGDQAVIVPLLREEMSKELGEKVVDSLALNVDTPENEVVTAAREAVEKYDAQADKQKIDHLNELDYDGGVGVTGFEKTLSALFNGQVQELYLSANPDDIVYRTGDVRLLLKDYAPGLDENLPEASEKEFLIDELIKQAANSADRIRFIEDSHLLKTAGGVGALLRYQVSEATTQ